MTFDQYWEAYCAHTGHPFAEGRAEAEEHWNANKGAYEPSTKKSEE